MKRHDPSLLAPPLGYRSSGSGPRCQGRGEPQECAEIAREFKLLAVATLTGTYHVDTFAGGARVKGGVVARVRRTCVVSLDAFDAELREPVDLAFAAMPGQGEASALGAGRSPSPSKRRIRPSRLPMAGSTSAPSRSNSWRSALILTRASQVSSSPMRTPRGGTAAISLRGARRLRPKALGGE